jgi:hypothetical protein
VWLYLEKVLFLKLFNPFTSGRLGPDACYLRS